MLCVKIKHEGDATYVEKSMKEADEDGLSIFFFFFSCVCLCACEKSHGF